MERKTVDNSLIYEDEAQRLIASNALRYGELGYDGNEVYSILEKVNRARLTCMMFDLMLQGKLFLSMNEQGELTGFPIDEEMEKEILKSFEEIL